eukprot:CAMPEP_0113905992 /NCGR_PEP_ID=MMETSP0780_2-20120614/24429_1 /TAXON_ID=652834 /ORGANISM="Palpitomonas bilix" /LENGTH=127 /DNA_ID=CAMNT_0000900401 /DNA_START=214 /DNA_END=594 /DNA_ORIENTATION=+ /assembly_acc=CAM_ASM_000599
MSQSQADPDVEMEVDETSDVQDPSQQGGMPMSWQDKDKDAQRGVGQGQGGGADRRPPLGRPIQRGGEPTMSYTAAILEKDRRADKVGAPALPEVHTPLLEGRSSSWTSPVGDDTTKKRLFSDTMEGS